MKLHDGIEQPAFAILRPGDDRFDMVFLDTSAAHVSKVAARLNPPGRVVPVTITVTRRQPGRERTK